MFYRLFGLINTQGSPSYYSGSRFIGVVREVDPYFPNYQRYIEQRKSAGKSESRKDYFYDILLEMNEEGRLRVLESILKSVAEAFPDEVSEIRSQLWGESAAVPVVHINESAWNAERLNRYLGDIDVRIGSGNYSGAVTLAYTCLEGFLKAFVKHHLPDATSASEILELSKMARAFLRNTINDYPDEALAMISHIGHTIDRTRNRFSEAHFDREADRWLAVFVRDLVNTEMRLLLHFMPQSGA